MSKKSIGLKSVLATVLLGFMLLSLCGCKADISAYADEKILISGLTEEDFYITPAQLAEMDCETATAMGKTAKAGVVKAYGPTIDTFLAQYGHTKDEFKSIRFVAGDDYDVLLGPLTWDSYDIILSIANGNDPLEEKQQPLRIVVPGAESNKWIRLVTEIRFTEKDSMTLN